MTSVEIRKTGIGITTFYLLEDGSTQKDIWDGKTVITTHPERKQIIGEIKSALSEIITEAEGEGK